MENDTNTSGAAVVDHQFWAKKLNEGTAVVAFNQNEIKLGVFSRRTPANFNDHGLEAVPTNFSVLPDFSKSSGDLYTKLEMTRLSNNEDVNTILDLYLGS